VLLANWINTLVMLLAIGGVAVLLWYRRPGSSSGEADDAIRPDERSESQGVAPA
jgi:hypothetical protein